MSSPGDHRGALPDRGDVGAGWSQSAPPAAPAGAQHRQGGPFGGPQGPGPSPQPMRRPHDARGAFAPGASVANTTGALIAVVSVVLVEFVSGLIGLLGAALVVHPFSTSGAGESLLSGFVTGVFAAPSPYYAGAFLALAFLTPVTPRSPLPTVLLRAVLAGAAGTIALALVGVVTGSVAAVRGGGARLVIDVVTSPLQDGVPFTLMLIATSTAAWLWLGRPRGAGRGPGAPGRPGTVRPPDAVPPATVQAGEQPFVPPRAQQPHDPAHPYGARRPPAPPYGAQQPPVPPYGAPHPPVDPWGGPGRH